MSPSSPARIPTRTPSHHVIVDGIYKSFGANQIRPHISARRLSEKLASNVDETWSSLLGAHASNTDAQTGQTDQAEWAHGMDEDSVERPEDICILSGGDWDLYDACWSADDVGAAEEKAPANDIHLENTAPVVENVWKEDVDLLQLLEDDAAPTSDVDEDAAGIWAAPQNCIF